MKLLVQSAMIFFGTLMAAGVVALGEPAGAHVAVKPAPVRVLASVPASSRDMAAVPGR